MSRRRFLAAGAAAGGGLVLLGRLGGLADSRAATPAPTTAPAPLEVRIAELAVREGADFLGAADMAGAYATLRKLQGKGFPFDPSHLPRVVSIGVHLFDDLVEPLPTAMPEYSRHFYSVVWPKAKIIARKVGELLRQDGWKVAYFAAGIEGMAKMAGRLSGLGWIGRSAMLVTPEAGPRAAWEAVLTDAPLKPTADKPDECHCGDCRRCADVCPAKAITGAGFKETDALAVRFLADRCEKHRQSYGNIFTDGGCGLCLKVCPYGGRRDVLAAGRSSTARCLLASATPAST
jgi:ferredoxin